MNLIHGEVECLSEALNSVVTQTQNNLGRSPKVVAGSGQRKSLCGGGTVVEGDEAL